LIFDGDHSVLLGLQSLIRRAYQDQQAYQAYLANGRENLAKTLRRGEVRGGGKKPWKQKGTGRARHGSRRSPIWVGGGIAHGPRASKDYSKKINRKAKAKALACTLSKKQAEKYKNLNTDLE
jgi:large subunit ribosomal protein L4